MFIAKRIKKREIEYENLKCPQFWGNKVQIDRIIIKAKQGAKINLIIWFLNGNTFSLVNNLTASAIGCNNPRKDTLLGPFRSWVNPKILRSKRVKNATLISTGTKIQRIEQAFKII